MIDYLQDKDEVDRKADLAGLNVAVKAAALSPKLAPSVPVSERRWSLTGNEARGLGALRGGVRFAAAYPITTPGY